MYACRSKEDIDARCKNLTALYAAIEKDGYKSQADLNTLEDDEIAVAIGRAGQFLFSDGAHRLAIAKLLNIQEVPVLVSVRHPDWAAFKSQVREFTKTQTLGKLYQQASHSDLMNIPAEHGSADRFNAIEPHLPVRTGNLLDIGSNLGYMCHRSEELGFDCIGIEIDETHLFFMEKLRDYSNRRFEVRAGSFLEDMELTTRDFEVVLALNIFHHFLKTEELYKLLVAFLGRLKVNRMVFEAHLPDELQMVDAYKNYPAEEFCNFIMEHTGLEKKELIFSAHDGREMFLLSK
jgi:2-polyprenyl-3-methyl-5-hydroxy-6-metoxy-1,4-benzoquinol methylase